MGRIRETCLAEGSRVPHRNTVRRGVMDLVPSSAARRLGEREIETAATPSPGQFVVDRPIAVWQIDHTLVDVIVVDEQLRRPLGRPALTIAIDLCARMVGAFIYLSRRRPACPLGFACFTLSMTRPPGSMIAELILLGL
jgi:putative transposase